MGTIFSAMTPFASWNLPMGLSRFDFTNRRACRAAAKKHNKLQFAYFSKGYCLSRRARFAQGIYLPGEVSSLRKAVQTVVNAVSESFVPDEHITDVKSVPAKLTAFFVHMFMLIWKLITSRAQAAGFMRKPKVRRGAYDWKSEKKLAIHRP